MASSIPATVSYMLTTFFPNALSTVPTVQIWFGKELAIYEAPMTLQITGIEGDQEWAELGGLKREEHYSVLCSLCSWAGDEDHKTRFTEVWTTLDLITVALANDATLGNNVRLAEFGNMVYTPESDARGKSLGMLAFDIRCQQRILTTN